MSTQLCCVGLGPFFFFLTSVGRVGEIRALAPHRASVEKRVNGSAVVSHAWAERSTSAESGGLMKMDKRHRPLAN